ncbi:MAG: hypothetical protein JJ958_12980 [Balneola sp.]|nr:hypothetical protein [Balneola sp.]
MNQPIYYYHFKTLPIDIRKANGIRTDKRLDCIQFSNGSGDHRGLDSLKNHKGMIYLNKVRANEIINTDVRRITDWSLTGRSRQAKCSINLTSLFNEHIEYPELYYGNPHNAIRLGNGAENPFFNYRYDGYLFRANKDLTELEMLILPDQVNLIRSWYQDFIDGELDQEIKQLRADCKPFYDYGYSKL